MAIARTAVSYGGGDTAAFQRWYQNYIATHGMVPPRNLVDQFLQAQLSVQASRAEAAKALGLQERGLDIQESLGERGLDIQETTAAGQLEIGRGQLELGREEMELRETLGLEGLELERERAALDKALAIESIGLTREQIENQQAANRVSGIATFGLAAGMFRPEGGYIKAAKGLLGLGAEPSAPAAAGTVIPGPATTGGYPFSLTSGTPAVGQTQLAFAGPPTSMPLQQATTAASLAAPAAGFATIPAAGFTGLAGAAAPGAGLAAGFTGLKGAAALPATAAFPAATAGAGTAGTTAIAPSMMAAAAPWAFGLGGAAAVIGTYPGFRPSRQIHQMIGESIVPNLAAGPQVAQNYLDRGEDIFGPGGGTLQDHAQALSRYALAEQEAGRGYSDVMTEIQQATSSEEAWDRFFVTQNKLGPYWQVSNPENALRYYNQLISMGRDPKDFGFTGDYLQGLRSHFGYDPDTNTLALGGFQDDLFG